MIGCVLFCLFLFEIIWCYCDFVGYGVNFCVEIDKVGRLVKVIFKLVMLIFQWIGLWQGFQFFMMMLLLVLQELFLVYIDLWYGFVVVEEGFVVVDCCYIVVVMEIGIVVMDFKVQCVYFVWLYWWFQCEGIDVYVFIGDIWCCVIYFVMDYSCVCIIGQLECIQWCFCLVFYDILIYCFIVVIFWIDFDFIGCCCDCWLRQINEMVVGLFIFCLQCMCIWFGNVLIQDVGVVVDLVIGCIGVDQ